MMNKIILNNDFREFFLVGSEICVMRKDIFELASFNI